jgi:hypothetical protein
MMQLESGQINLHYVSVDLILVLGKSTRSVYDMRLWTGICTFMRLMSLDQDMDSMLEIILSG